MTGSSEAEKGNLKAVKHGAFSERIPLSERGQALVRTGISYLMSIKGVREEYVPLVQRIERLWIVLLKFDEYEDACPDKIDHAHYKHKTSFENSFQRSLALLFTLAGKRKDIKNIFDLSEEIAESNAGGKQ